MMLLGWTVPGPGVFLVLDTFNKCKVSRFHRWDALSAVNLRTGQ